jgi:hypothetical protein
MILTRLEIHTAEHSLGITPCANAVRARHVTGLHEVMMQSNGVGSR